MKLYQAFDVDEETPVQYAGVYVTRWQSGWGEPAILFREADSKTQRLIDATPDLLVGMARAEQTLRNLARCGVLVGDFAEIVENEAENLRRDIAKATTDTDD